MQAEMNSPVGVQTFKDPVCQMNVAPERAAGSYEYKGETYYFCSKGCLNRFQADPEKYLDRPASAPPAPMQVVSLSKAPSRTSPDEALYTCPMHPEVQQRGPGFCPKCGMALEPMVVTGEESNAELTDINRRFKISLVLTAPLLLLAMSDLIPGQPVQHTFSPGVLKYIQLMLATPVVVWGGWPFFERGWHSVVNRSLNMFTLIAIGTGVAYFYSVIATFFPGIFPASFREHGGEVGLYYEVAAVIVTLVLLGQVLELRARSQTSSAIRALLGSRRRLRG